MAARFTVFTCKFSISSVTNFLLSYSYRGYKKCFSVTVNF